MIILDATTKSLEIDLNAAITTNQLPFVVSYADISQSTFALTALSESDGATNGTTAVTLLAAPGASTSRQVKFISVKNSDTVATLLWIQLNNNATLREIWKGTLQVNDTLFLVDAANYLVIDANGNIKTTVGTVPTSIILGTTTNDNAAAGRIGEYTESVVEQASAVSLSTGTAANVTSLSLTAGDWQLSGFVAIVPGATTNIVSSFNGISTTSATFGAADTINTNAINSAAGVVYGANNIRASTQVLRFSLSSTTTVYLVANCNFTVSTADVFGTLRARRMR